jgi:vitamin B12 transporter
MNTRLLASVRRRSLIQLAAACVAAPLFLCAQDDVQSLAPVVVSATRTGQDPAYLPSSVTTLALPDLADRQIPDLRTALSQTPGVIVVNSGAVGGQSSVFVRGANSDQTLFVVDGVRFNTTTASYVNFLGAADLSGLDRLEVLRGPQSTLYGSSAMGGVIMMETAHGGSQPSGTVSAYAGSFGSLGAEAAATGAGGGMDYSFSLAREQTDNYRAYNDYKCWSYSARLEGQITPWLLVGTTLRGLDSHSEEPGAITYPSRGDTRSSTKLVTAYAEAHAGAGLRSRLTCALYRNEYTFDDGTSWNYYYARSTRGILDWQNTWEAAAWAELVGGVNAEQSHYVAGGMMKDRSLAGYFSSTLRPVSEVELTAGARRDHFDTAGDATTWRTGAAYVPVKNTKLRATFGTGFNAPTPGDLFGSPPYILPNQAVRPEKSRGWDVGIDETMLDSRLTLSATYFENRFRDLLEYEIEDPVTYVGEMINIDRATTRGVELAASARLCPAATARIGYTYMDATDDVTDTRLIRRPRHTLDCGIETRVTKRWMLGGGAHVVADRVDGAYGPTPLAGYTTFRLYSSYALQPNLILKVRAENLLDRTYQEVAGYPALPRALYGSVEWRF